MERCYVFFRVWENFAPGSDFPFEKFNSHSDSSFMPRRPRKPEPSPECSLGCRNAFNLGWITTELRKFGDWSPSPKCFLMRVDEAGFAANVVKALTEWWPTSECRVLYDHLNPRFGYVPASQFTLAVQAVINAGMDRLPKLKPADMRDVREELLQLAAAEAMELGRQLVSICKSGTPPDVTVADQTNIDLPDEEINDAIEAYMVNYRREYKSEFDKRVGDRAKRLSEALTDRAKQRTHRPAAPEELVSVSCDTATPAGAAGITESNGTGADANASATAEPSHDAAAENPPDPPLTLVDIPPLDEANGDWMKQGKAATLLQSDVQTLANERLESRGGRKFEKGLCGIACFSRRWRKKSKNAKQIWYYLPSPSENI